LDSDLNRNQ